MATATDSETRQAPAPGGATSRAAAPGRTRVRVAEGAVGALGPGDVLAQIDVLLDALAEVQAAIGALEGRRAAVLAQLVDAAERSESAVLAPTDPRVRRTSSARRRELARRAVVAEVATTLHVGEHAAGTLCDHAQTLTTKAPQSLAALAQGRCSWAHASRVARQVADLAPQDARRVDATVATELAAATPGQVEARVRRTRESVHPEPLEVRHERAASERAVFLDDDRDGMAWLSARLPASLAHAAYDRLCRAAVSLRTTGDPRTAGQGRADAMAALLLDDGTLERSTPPAALRGAADPTGQASPTGSAPAAVGEDFPTVPVPGAGLGSLAVLARSLRPRVTVTVPVLTLLGGADIPADLEGYGPVDANTARELVALAPSLRRVLTHPETGVVLSVGRDSYTVPSSLKAALVRRDATCRFPGCTAPARRADLDHTRAWADGGRTDADNLAHLCRHHHVLKHQSAWTVRTAPRTPPARGGPTGEPPWGGTLEWTSPTGRRHLTTPDGSLPASLHRELPESPLPAGRAGVGSDPPDGDPPF
ncbi:HNH endonuclease signature motif containing protein [Isoptericola aurantiacus]|uniref:HNH endonuclease signature motif containing protein n=1 Tax=Isoptericola aurantiacus TaxID=3377839 RepID=UPI00383A1F2C